MCIAQYIASSRTTVYNIIEIIYVNKCNLMQFNNIVIFFQQILYIHIVWWYGGLWINMRLLLSIYKLSNKNSFMLFYSQKYFNFVFPHIYIVYVHIWIVCSIFCLNTNRHKLNRRTFLSPIKIPVNSKKLLIV